jgi:hypothetical protein
MSTINDLAVLVTNLQNSVNNISASFASVQSNIGSINIVDTN